MRLILEFVSPVSTYLVVTFIGTTWAGATLLTDAAMQDEAPCDKPVINGNVQV